jgi:carbon storage regulator
MLVLTRKLMERIYIGEEICVTVVRLESGQVRLGIDAPRHIPVVRGELTPRPRETAPPADPTPGASPAAPLDFRSPPTAPRGGDSPPRAPSR